MMYGSVDAPKRDNPTSSGDLSRERSFVSRRAIFCMLLLVVSLAVIISQRVQESTEPNLQSVNSTPESPSHRIHKISCGHLDLMKLSCRAIVKAETMSKVFLEYTPIDYHASRCTSTICVSKSGTLRTKNIEITKIGLTSIDFYRLRPDTSYMLKLYVLETEDYAKLSDNITFVTEKTGYYHFDTGPLTIVSGATHYPLLQFPLHTDSFRGVVVTDQDGYLVWYYNTSATNVGGSHVEAVEQSKLHHVWCINDQGENDGTGKQISIIDAAGNILALKKWDHETDSTNFPTGHECRFVDGHTDGEMSKRILTVAEKSHYLENGIIDEIVYQENAYNVAEIQPEYIHVLSADNDNQNLKIESNVSLNALVNFQTMLKYYHAAEISQIETWDDLTLEFTSITGSNGLYSFRWIHASSVTVSDDGSTYIVTFRDCAVVAGIYKHDHTLRFLISSIIPDIGTHEFDNNYHKFYIPHDGSFYGNDTLCLVDDGFGRPEGACDTNEVSTCFSRAVCYTLNDDLKVIQLDWEFEYKYEFHGGPLAEYYEEMDLYNMNGGSLRRLGERSWTLSFTHVWQSGNTSGYVFGIDQTDTHNQTLTSITKLPRCRKWASSTGSSGSYRANPIHSIDGETYVD